MTQIKQNISIIKEQIKQAAVQCGRDPKQITLVAVSKRHSVESIIEAYEAGQRDFGENYAQELRDKAKELAHLKDIKWHFIGNLQRNKVKYIAHCVDLMETVDSLKLIDELEKHAQKIDRKINCLVQVNVGGEEQKSGCDADQALKLVEAIEKSEKLTVFGLMTIPPWNLEPEETSMHFANLAQLRNVICEGSSAAADSFDYKDRLPHLSMGMSHDFEAAVKKGATYVRVGTAIFGVRSPG